MYFQLSENFNVKVNENIFNLLEADRVNFNIKSRNLLINKIIKYYFEKNPERLEMTLKNQLLKVLREKESNLAIETIIKLIKTEIFPSLNKKSKEQNFQLNFRLTSENLDDFSRFCPEERNKKMGLNNSDFFREVFDWYSRKKSYEREEILYNDIIKKLNIYISEKKVIELGVKTFSEELKIISCPLAIIESKNENFSYLLTYSEEKDKITKKNTGKFGIFPTRISNITAIIPTRKNYKKSIEDELDGPEFKIGRLTLEQLEKRIKNKEITQGEEKEIKIWLSEQGYHQYRIIIHNRPKYKEIEKIETEDKKEYILSFHSTEYAILMYFFNFGKEAKVLSPDSLRKTFREKYEKALKNYI